MHMASFVQLPKSFAKNEMYTTTYPLSFIIIKLQFLREEKLDHTCL